MFKNKIDTLRYFIIDVLVNHSLQSFNSDGEFFELLIREVTEQSWGSLTPSQIRI